MISRYSICKKSISILLIFICLGTFPTSTEQHILFENLSSGLLNNPNDDTLDQFQIIWNAGIAIERPNLLAQSFKPTKNTLTRVMLLIHKIDNPVGNLTITIRKTLNGSDLTLCSVPPEQIPTSREWVEFNFDDIFVNIDHAYYIIFSPQTSGMNYVWWGSDNHNFDNYPYGEAWFYSNGNWSTEGFVIKDWCFKTYACHTSNPPDIPSTPSGPTEGYTWILYSYETSTKDSDGDPVRYGWDWNGDNIVDEWSIYYSSEDTHNTSHSWYSPGIYQVKVRAEDIYGVQSEFSPPLSITIINDPPNPPSQPSGPILGMTNTLYLYSTMTTDNEEDNVSYGWDWDGDDLVDEWMNSFYPSGNIVNATHSWSTEGIYYVKVKAKDEKRAQSNFSIGTRVIIVAIDNDPPEKPNTPTGSTKCKVKTSYSYSSSTIDPNGDRLYYLFDWDDGTNSSWVGPFDSGQTVVASHIWNVKGSYQIKVKARDSKQAESLWSEPLPIKISEEKKGVKHNYFQALNRILDLLSKF